MTDRFETCWPFTLIQECPLPQDWSNARNFSHDAHDPGGATMCGIIQREYDAYRKSIKMPVQSVRYITREEGEDIYRSSYWQPECLVMPPGLDLSFFDAAVNEGTHQAIKLLQVALGVPNDGRWGPQTLAHVQAFTDVSALIVRFTDRSKTVYREFAGFRYFGSDWIRRSNEIGQQSMAMARGTATVMVG